MISNFWQRVGKPTLDFFSMGIIKLWRCHMSSKDIVKKVTAICEPIADSLNFELVDVEFIKEFGSYYLRVYIHKTGGISLDDCQLMSEALSEKLDEKDPISMAYYLEVSSPGLDRPLKTDKDFNRNLGKEVEVNLYTSINNQKHYEGVLDSFTDEVITLIDEKNNKFQIPRESISVVKLAVKF